MAPTAGNGQITDSVAQASKGMFIGDAVSMPVHWYYNAQQIKEDYNGWISKYEEPKAIHPGSKGLSLPDPVLHNGKQIQLIGDVILKGKTHAYAKDAKSTHYHQGIKAGDNTLNCYCMLMVMKTQRKASASINTEELAKQIFSNYVELMTSAGTHPDPYAEGFHKNFFTDWLLADKPTDLDALFKFVTERAKKIEADTSGKYAQYIGCFWIALPAVLHHITKSNEEVIKLAKLLVGASHPGKHVFDALESYIRVLRAVVHGASLKDEAEKAFVEYLGPEGKTKLEKFDKLVQESAADKLSAFQIIAQELGLSCPVKQAYPVVLYLARHFHDDFEGGILANVNIGGENCARGPSLGALLGAALGARGQKIPEKWTKPLVLNTTLEELLSQC